MAARYRMASAVLTALALVGVAGCTGTSPSETREAAVYEELVRWVIGVDAAAGAADQPGVFIDSLHEDGIALEVQVDTIDRLGDELDVRFIDDQAEALSDDEALSVRDGGVLIGLGAVPSASPVVVRVEVYRSLADKAAYLVALVGSGDSWRLDGEPEALPVAELVEDE